MDSAEGLRQLMIRYGFAGESLETERMLGYMALLEKWNRRMNLTASTSWPQISWLFEEALWGARWYPAAGVRHLDIGSGAGFPALPLRIVRPEMHLTMVESRAKRVAFLETVASTVRLGGAECFCSLIEEFLQQESLPKWDIFSWKAMRLSKTAFRQIQERSATAAQIWIFHGPELPFEDPAESVASLRLLRREHFPGNRARLLSIFAVSRETCST